MYENMDGETAVAETTFTSSMQGAVCLRVVRTLGLSVQCTLRSYTREWLSAHVVCECVCVNTYVCVCVRARVCVCVVQVH